MANTAAKRTYYLVKYVIKGKFFSEKISNFNHLKTLVETVAKKKGKIVSTEKYLVKGLTIAEDKSLSNLIFNKTWDEDNF